MTMGREECIDMFYAQISKDMAISRSAFGDNLRDWEAVPLMIGDRHVGAYILKDHEIHTCVEKSDALRHMRKLIRQGVAYQVEKLGYLTTRSPDEPSVLKFLTRLGFYRTGNDGQFVTLRCDAIKIK